MNRLLPTVAMASFAVMTGIAFAQNSPVTVQLGEQNKSGETGTATITPQGSKTQIVLQMKGAPAEAQPAHMRTPVGGRADRCRTSPGRFASGPGRRRRPDSPGRASRSGS